MTSRSEAERLECYRSSLVGAWRYIDYNDWPIKLNSVFHLFLEEYGEEWIEDFGFLHGVAGWPLERIAKAFGNPARLYRSIDTVLYGLRRRREPLETQQRLTIKILDMVRALKHGSEFNEDGRNIILSPEALSPLAEALKEAPCGVELSALAHRFCGLMWSYTESTFFRAHDVTKEIHGPYPWPGSTGAILVKDYLNLHPDPLWPETKLLPCSSIRIIFGYGADVKLSIDAMNHLYNDGARPVQQLVSCLVEVDGERVPAETLRELVPLAQSTIKENAARVDAMSWHDRVAKYAEIFWFRKRPLRMARNLPWQLPERVREKIRAGSVNPKRIPRLSAEEVARLARVTI